MVEKKKSMGEVCHNIANELLSRYKFITIPGKKLDEIYVYLNGVYESSGKDIIRAEVEQILGPNCKTHYVNEVVNKIARKSLTKRENLGNKDVNLICLNNGVLNLKTMKLLPHKPEYRFMSKIPVNYVEGVKCPKIEDFIHDILYEDDIAVIQEWFGYLLYRGYHIKKGIIFVGDGDTGKTTLLTLIGKFIGEKNISGVSLQKLSLDKFSNAQLYNKHVNIYDDLSATDVADTGSFKMVTGGGYVQGEYKFGDQFQFINFAKLTFTTNKIPMTKLNDDDIAYYKRWIVLMFENIFDDNNKKTDKHLIDKITTEKELSGLLNWALVGLKRLLEKNAFSYEKDVEDIRRIIQRNASDLARFSQDCLIEEEGVWISKQDLYEEYKEFCKLNILPVITKEKFGRDITKACQFIVDGRQGAKTGWRNVRVEKVKPVMGF